MYTEGMSCQQTADLGHMRVVRSLELGQLPEYTQASCPAAAQHGEGPVGKGGYDTVFKKLGCQRALVRKR